jgi:hypothetical protein
MHPNHLLKHLLEHCLIRWLFLFLAYLGLFLFPNRCFSQYDVVTWEPYRLLKPHQIKEDLHMVALALAQLKQTAQSQLPFDTAQLNIAYNQLSHIRDTVSQPKTELAFAQLVYQALAPMSYAFVRLSEDAELFLNTAAAETLQIAEVSYRESGSYQWRSDAMEDRRLKTVSDCIDIFSEKYLTKNNDQSGRIKARIAQFRFNWITSEHLRAMAFYHASGIINGTLPRKTLTRVVPYHENPTTEIYIYIENDVELYLTYLMLGLHPVPTSFQPYKTSFGAIDQLDKVRWNTKPVLPAKAIEVESKDTIRVPLSFFIHLSNEASKPLLADQASICTNTNPLQLAWKPIMRLPNSKLQLYLPSILDTPQPANPNSCITE